MYFFSAVIFFQFLVFKALEPDWIRVGIQPKMLDLDPDEMNADPQPCKKLSYLLIFGRTACRWASSPPFRQTGSQKIQELPYTFYFRRAVWCLSNGLERLLAQQFFSLKKSAPANKVGRQDKPSAEKWGDQRDFCMKQQRTLNSDPLQWIWQPPIPNSNFWCFPIWVPTEKNRVSMG